MLLSLSWELVRNAQIVAQDEKLSLKAGYRVINNIPPASRGKPEYKDCFIIEHYLALCSELRGRGFIEAAYFISSNTSDYGNPKSMDSRLQRDFDSVKLTYLSALEWANSLVK